MVPDSVFGLGEALEKHEVNFSFRPSLCFLRKMGEASGISTFEPVGSGVRSLSITLVHGTWQHDVSSDVEKKIYKPPQTKPNKAGYGIS